MAKDDEHRDVIMHDVLAAVGDLMLRWGFLENAMREKLDGDVGGPFIVQRWLASAEPDEMIDEIRDAAVIRHLLAHGLCAVYARPPNADEAHIHCRNAKGELVAITLAELESVAKRPDRLRLCVIQPHLRARLSG